MARHDKKRKLTAEQVLEIRSAKHWGCQTEFAAKYGVSDCAIHAVVHFKTYKEVRKVPLPVLNWRVKAIRHKNLTPHQARAVQASTLPDDELAKEYRVSEETITKARNRLTYK